LREGARGGGGGGGGGRMVEGWPAKGPSGTSSGSLREMASVPEMRAVLEELQVQTPPAHSCLRRRTGAVTEIPLRFDSFVSVANYHDKNRISD
jgi:hypothetical protein